MMAGQRQFQAAAHRGAVDRRDPRLAAGLHAAGDLRQLAAFFEQKFVRPFLAFRFPQFRERAALRLQHAQIGAGAERLLAGGEHCALDGGVGRDPLDDRRQLFHHFGVDHVHRPARHVPGDQGNAVGIDLEGEILEGHTHLPFVSLFASPQRQRENYFEYGLPSLWLKCPPLSSRIITRSRSGYSARSCFERVPISRKIASRPDLLTR